MVVVDANAAANVALQTPDGLAIAQLLLEGEQAHAPNLFRTEVASTFWKYVHLGLKTPEDARSAMHKAIDLIDVFHDTADMDDECFNAAVQFDHAIYDMRYLVLARRMGATLVTLDKKLMHLCQQAGVACIHPVIDLQDEAAR